MMEEKKFIRRSFWVHQYEMEETFLSEMARDGWHFKELHIGFPTKYEFVKGENIDYIYRLDFVSFREDKADYHQLFADAGWDEVYTWPGIGGRWYYFRRIRTGGKADLIYTDPESKYRLYDKLWKRFGIYFILAFLIELNGIRICMDITQREGLLTATGVVMTSLSALFCIFAALFCYFSIALLIERNRLRHRIDSL